jgi:hypothetical protein
MMTMTTMREQQQQQEKEQPTNQEILFKSFFMSLIL